MQFLTVRASSSHQTFSSGFLSRSKEAGACGADPSHIRFFSFSLIEGYVSLVMDEQTAQRWAEKTPPQARSGSAAEPLRLFWRAAGFLGGGEGVVGLLLSDNEALGWTRRARVSAGVALTHRSVFSPLIKQRAHRRFWSEPDPSPVGSGETKTVCCLKGIIRLNYSALMLNRTFLLPSFLFTFLMFAARRFDTFYWRKSLKAKNDFSKSSIIYLFFSHGWNFN